MSLAMALIRFPLENAEQGLNIAEIVSSFSSAVLAATILINSPILAVTTIILALHSGLQTAFQWRGLLVFLIDLSLISALTVAINAFWQTTKAALHYKAASKQEGIDLQFQNR